jgi:hypothetical protein
MFLQKYVKEQLNNHTSFDCASFQEIACSLPPLPITRTFAISSNIQTATI